MSHKELLTCLCLMMLLDWKTYKNKLLKLFKNRAHHQHDAYASFWSSKADEKHHWCDVDEWTKDDYCYLAEEFSQDERYTEEIT